MKNLIRGTTLSLMNQMNIELNILLQMRRLAITFVKSNQNVNLVMSEISTEQNAFKENKEITLLFSLIQF